MANISIKKDFEDGQKLFAQQLNNNFETIELGINTGNKLIWKDDNGAEFQTFRGTTEEIEDRPIIDGQKLYDIENGDTFLDVGETRKVMNKPLWKDDNGAQVQSFRGTTAEVAARPIIDGQTLYNIETGETALDVGNNRISTGAGNVVYIGDEEPQNDATKIWIENDQVLNLGSEVAISSEEPTTQEKVWLQKGKNLIEYYSIGHVNGLTGELDTDTNWNHSQLIKVRPGEKYTFSIESTTSQQWLLAYYKEDGAFISMDYGDFSSGYNFIVKSMPSNCHKVYVGWRADKNYSNVQLEQGEEATSYEPYIPKKIHTKNDNGYEEFYNEEEHKEVILFDGAPTTGDVSLKDSVSHYKYIEVFYYTYPSNFSSVKVPSNASNISCVLVDFDLTYSENHGFVLQFKGLINNDTQLIVGGKGRFYKYQNSTDITQDTQNQIYVSKVVGYK